MPLCRSDADLAEDIAEEARRFAELVLNAPKDDKAPVQPAVRAILNAFVGINKVLSAGNQKDRFTRFQVTRLARHFAAMGEAFGRWK